MKIRQWIVAAAAATSLVAGSAFAQVPQYGPNVTLEQAKKALAAAQADAVKRGWPMAIAVVDNAGHLVAFEKLDNTQNASVLIAQDKAVSSAMLRRSTKVIQDGVAGGGAGLRLLALRYASPIEGGLPLVIDGRIVGGIGVSGMTSEQDGVIAKTGADALLK